jgi:acetyltransferase-like isoleucine patch superfamily enzyme
VVIGDQCLFTYHALIQCSTRIEIGDRCIFAQSASVADGNHRFRDLGRPMLDQGYDFREIEIGDDVAVMAKCTIVAGIGTRTVVRANSVVARDQPAHVVAVGLPARPVDYFGPPGGEPPELRRSASSSGGADPASSGADAQASRKSGASS